MAAGRGSRLGKLTDDIPKCCMQLGGRRLIDLQRQALSGAGIHQHAVVAGYRAEVLADGPWTTFQDPRWSTTNIVRSLLAAISWLRADACVVSYSDIFYTAETIAALMADPADIAIGYDPTWLDLWSERFVDPLEDAETFRLSATGEDVVEIGGKAKTTAQIEGQYMGLLKFTVKGWSIVERFLESFSEERIDNLDVTSLLQLLINNGEKVRAVPRLGEWGEVDSESDLALYRAKLALGQPPDE